MEPGPGLSWVATRARLKGQAQVRLLDDIRGRDRVTHSPSRESAQLGGMVDVGVGDLSEIQIYCGAPMSLHCSGEECRADDEP
jgi:hypothetical protein